MPSMISPIFMNSSSGSSPHSFNSNSPSLINKKILRKSASMANLDTVANATTNSSSSGGNGGNDKFNTKILDKDDSKVNEEV